MTKDSTENYKLKLVGSGITFDRQVSLGVAQQIIALALGGQMGAQSPASVHTGVIPGTNGRPATKNSNVTPKVFMVEKNPSTDHEKIACLAFYMAHYEDKPTFKTADFTDVATRAAQHFSNLPGAVKNATNKYRFLVKAAGDMKQLSPRGEAVAIALPDRNKVETALEAHPIRMKKGGRRKGSKSKK
jgi:hypothetical protein